jgi:outer membrane lipoprotein-sorting protein
MVMSVLGTKDFDQQHNNKWITQMKFSYNRPTTVKTITTTDDQGETITVSIGDLVWFRSGAGEVTKIEKYQHLVVFTIKNNDGEHLVDNDRIWIED